jgi:hypothetical protein
VLVETAGHRDDHAVEDQRASRQTDMRGVLDVGTGRAPSRASITSSGVPMLGET